jgi:hypothetical protein
MPMLRELFMPDHPSAVMVENHSASAAANSAFPLDPSARVAAQAMTLFDSGNVAGMSSAYLEWTLVSVFIYATYTLFFFRWR